MTEKTRGGEQKVYIGKDTALSVYCATCAHVLMELAATDEGKHSRARMCASSHWNAYRENHLIMIISPDEKRVEYLRDSDQFKDFMNND